VCEGIRRREGASLEEAARHWVIANETMLADLEHLERSVCITYESLCAEPMIHLDRLQDFLGLEAPFDASVVTQPRRIHNIDGASEMIRNFNARSLAQLTRDDCALIDRIAGPLMERLGYERYRHQSPLAA
jgi:hypothetical protein